MPARSGDDSSPSDEQRCVEALRAGLVVLIPTDTVYGIAALPSVAGATAALVALKDRSEQQPLAVLVASVDQALALVEPPTAPVRAAMERFWPGPLTLVLRRSRASAELELGGDPATIGIRCPDHDLVRALADAVGPLATTSANRHGQPTPATAGAAAAALTGPVAVVVDAGEVAGRASTVIALAASAPEVLREGGLPSNEVLAILDPEVP